MTEAEIYNMLKTTGLPVAYNHFTKKVDLPYVVYLFSYSSNFAADNKVYQDIDNFQIELYSNKKDVASEQLIENLLNENEIYYEKSGSYIESERMYQVIYEI